MADKKISELPFGDLTANSLIPIVTNSVTSQTSFGVLLSKIPTFSDTYTTGGTYNEITGVATFTNNTGGTFSVTGFSTSTGSGSFTGGTVNGETIFTNGLTADTISATTYLNLPTDVKVTGFTFNIGNYDLTIFNSDNTNFTQSLGILSTDMTVTGGTYDLNSGEVTFTNNSGGTFNVSGFVTGYTDIYTTGGTYSDGTTVFTKTNGETYSVTGYTDIYTTGGTYSAGTTVFTNNTGGTFNITGFTTGAAWYAENATPPATLPIASGTNSIAFGSGAKALSTSMFVVGYQSGLNATGASGSNFIGYRAGSGANAADNSNFLGQSAGYQATGASYSNFIGKDAGNGATGAYRSNFFGAYAGYYATGENQSNFFGFGAGGSAYNADNSNFFGLNAGYQATNASYSNFFGFNAGNESSGHTVNAFGPFAGNANRLNGQTIFSNSSLPSYANRSAATTAITVLNGASAGSTYLYYNETTFAIEGVRL